MPELPDILAYRAALRSRVVGRRLESVLVVSPFLLRTFEPALDETEGRRVQRVDRLGKRLVFSLEGKLHLLLHLMIAGRLLWTDDPAAKPPGKVGLAVFRFEHGAVLLTEASPKKRAALHVVRGDAALASFDRGGLDVLACDAEVFHDRLLSENHTLKRALTDPRLFDGIGNAYSDEILHAAQLSPLTWTSRLSDGEVAHLFDATRSVLTQWIDALQSRFAKRFPGKGDITAFRPGFAVHGKFGQPCPACGAKVQRIRYADNETNYCPRCQTDGKILADRSLSRLLKGDWPKHVDELEDGHA